MSPPIIEMPGLDHLISVTKNDNRIVVTAGCKVTAETTRALTLSESGCSAVIYIPRDDTDMATLQSTGTHTYCPYKGQASYFSIPEGGSQSVDAVWSYEAPHAAVADIKGHLTFYPHRVDAIEEDEA